MILINFTIANRFRKKILALENLHSYRILKEYVAASLIDYYLLFIKKMAHPTLSYDPEMLKIKT